MTTTAPAPASQTLTPEQETLARLSAEIRVLREKGVTAPRFSPAREGKRVIATLVPDLVAEVQEIVGAKRVKGINLKLTVAADGTVTIDRSSVSFHGTTDGTARVLSDEHKAAMQKERAKIAAMTPAAREKYQAAKLAAKESARVQAKDERRKAREAKAAEAQTATETAPSGQQGGGNGK